MKWGLVSYESFEPNTEKIEGFYKADNLLMILPFGLPYLFSVI